MGNEIATTGKIASTASKSTMIGSTASTAKKSPLGKIAKPAKKSKMGSIAKTAKKTLKTTKESLNPVNIVKNVKEAFSPSAWKKKKPSAK